MKQFDKNDKEFWQKYYQKYLNGERIDLDLDIHLTTIVNIFKELGFKTKKEKVREDNKILDELLKKYVFAEVTKTYILEFLKITQTEFYNKLRKLGYKTQTHYYSKKIGYIRRDDIEFWTDLHRQYYDGILSTKQIEEKYGIDDVTLIRFFEERGFKRCSKEIVEQRRFEAQKKTNILRYGDEIFFKTKEFKHKQKQVFLKHFGVDHPWKSLDVIKRLKKTWGVDNPFQLKRVKNNIVQNNIRLASIRKKEWLESFSFQLLETYTGLCENDKNKKRYQIKHLVCNTIFFDDLVYLPKCPVCQTIHGVSNQEIEIYDYISSITNYRLVSSSKRHIVSRKHPNRHYQIDILVPDLKIGFEYNGTYFHSTNAYFHSDLSVDKEYHKYKTEKALEVGIKLYHVWEYENKEDSKTRIKTVLNGEKVDLSIVDKNIIKVNRDWCPSFQDSIYYGRYQFINYSEPILKIVNRSNCFSSGEVLFDLTKLI